MEPRVKNRLNVACSIASIGIVLEFRRPEAARFGRTAKTEVFPTGAQFGGEVFAKTLGPKKKFPTDFDVYDLNGNPIDLGKLVHGKNIS